MCAGLVLGMHALSRPDEATEAINAIDIDAIDASNLFDQSQDLTDGPHPRVEGHLLEDRWFYLSTNFIRVENVATINALLDRAKAAGFNGMLVNDVKFGRLFGGSLPDPYFRNLHSVLDHARELEMKVIPATAHFGYSEEILYHDPNLAEGLPVRYAPYVAGEKHIVPDDDLSLINGDFEELPASGHTFPGWRYQDAPGEATFVDRNVKVDGAASLRMENLGQTNGPSGNGRIYQSLDVEPFQIYRASVWVRTRDFEGGSVRLAVIGDQDGQMLQWNFIDVDRNTDWTRFDTTFNTLDHSTVNVYLGVWGGSRGRIWWDEAFVEAAGPVNLLRRPGTPIHLSDISEEIEYEEGRDFYEIIDFEMGTNPWPGSYDLWHYPPPIEIAEGSRIREGQSLKFSFYHAGIVQGGQVAASLSEPAVFDIVQRQLQSLEAEFSHAEIFTGFMFSHDEIRVHGWDTAPGVADGTPGEVLAGNVREVRRLAREIDPEADIYIWSDMFDPFHNARELEGERYYLVKGEWVGSWEGLSPDMTIMNWHFFGDERVDAAEFFADRGHEQILAGYYDRSGGNFFDRDWLRDLAGVSGIRGVMYTPWYSGYEQLEAWAEAIWGDAQWEGAKGEGPSPTPIETPEVTPSTGPPPVESPTPTPAPSLIPGELYLPLLAKDFR